MPKNPVRKVIGRNTVDTAAKLLHDPVLTVVDLVHVDVHHRRQPVAFALQQVADVRQVDRQVPQVAAGVVGHVLERIDHDEAPGTDQITCRIHRSAERVHPASGLEQLVELLLVERFGEDPILQVGQLVIDLLQCIGERADEGREDPRQHGRHRRAVRSRRGRPDRAGPRAAGTGLPADRDDRAGS